MAHDLAAERTLRLTRFSRQLLRRLATTHSGNELWPLVQHLSVALGGTSVSLFLRDAALDGFREHATTVAHQRPLLLPGNQLQSWHSHMRAGRWFRREPELEPAQMRRVLDEAGFQSCLPLNNHHSTAGLLMLGAFEGMSRQAELLLDDIGREAATLLQTIELRQLATTDPLTKLVRRNVVEERISHEIERALRSHAPFSTIMADIDFFKAVNDRFGHHAGDAVLQQVAAILKTIVRRVDLVGRWGGEEFMIVLPETNAVGASVMAEKLRLAIMRANFDLGGESIQLTASFGVAQFDPTAETEPNQLIDRADYALYQAKLEGRNCVRVDGYRAGPAARNAFNITATSTAS